jgi:hypothetical protein
MRLCIHFANSILARDQKTFHFHDYRIQFRPQLFNFQFTIQIRGSWNLMDWVESTVIIFPVCNKTCS